MPVCLDGVEPKRINGIIRCTKIILGHAVAPRAERHLEPSALRDKESLGFHRIWMDNQFGPPKSRQKDFEEQVESTVSRVGLTETGTAEEHRLQYPTVAQVMDELDLRSLDVFWG